jgi:hypothetical protein
VRLRLSQWHQWLSQCHQPKNEVFKEIQAWTLVPGSEEKQKQYAAVYEVVDLTKRPILEGRKPKFEPAFSMTLENGTTITFKDTQRIKIPGIKSLSDVVREQIGSGRVRFLIFIGPQDKESEQIDAILAAMKVSKLSGDYQYPAKSDAQSRLEWDAYTFARNEEPEDK